MVLCFVLYVHLHLKCTLLWIIYIEYNVHVCMGFRVRGIIHMLLLLQSFAWLVICQYYITKFLNLTFLSTSCTSIRQLALVNSSEGVNKLIDVDWPFEMRQQNFARASKGMSYLSEWRAGQFSNMSSSVNQMYCKLYNDFDMTRNSTYSPKMKF